MAVKKRPLPKQFKPTEKAIFELVSKKGVSKSICISKLKLSVNYFNQYQGTADNFNTAMAHFTSEVLMVSVIENLSFDSPSRKYLMQKLRVFDQEIELPIKNMKTAKHASQNLSFALTAYARKQIGDETLQAVRQACDVYSNLMTATVLEQKINDLEQLFKDKYEKH